MSLWTSSRGRLLRELLVGNFDDAILRIHTHFSRAHRSGKEVSDMLKTQLAVHHLSGIDLTGIHAYYPFLNHIILPLMCNLEISSV